MHDSERHERRGKAAREHQCGDAPVDVAVAVMGSRAGDLGQRGEPQIGSDRHRQVEPECAEQQRRHERPGPDAGTADQDSGGEAEKCGWDGHGRFSGGMSGS
ncbi:hypothetical protein GALL_400480 [mine drainage metagenome]|uniref:Uncharacterized protein n=1 Tax=mine drainage metagenome TaxID=410659 RepID=A0A1J5QE10_9ZZZZ